MVPLNAMPQPDQEMLVSGGGQFKPPIIKTISAGLNGSVLKPTEMKQLQTSRLRFAILLLFCLYSMSNAFQWIEYSIINNIICDYYDVSSVAVNWTSVVYMVIYIPLIFPASWLLEKRGLRCAVLLGSLGTCVGSWVKCLSVAPDRFHVTMIGQSIVAMSQIFILGIPPRLAAVWFSDSEVSTACAVGVFGNQVGIALGFLLPPTLVPDIGTEGVGQLGNATRLGHKDDVGHALSLLFYGVAGFTSLLFLIILLAFKDHPEIAPSRAQAALSDQEAQENYWTSIRNLATNKNYVILLITYGINVGVFYAISTLLNQLVLAYFPHRGIETGWMGLTIVISGMGGSVLGGVVLDKTHKFKETTLVVYALSLAGMVAFMLTLAYANFWVVFTVAGLLGFFMTGYLPVGFEFAAEVTYPESEGTSSGLLNASAQVFGILFTLVGSWLFELYGDLVINICLVVALVIGTVMTGFIRSDLRRQRAAQDGHLRDSMSSNRLLPSNAIVSPIV